MARKSKSWVETWRSFYDDSTNSWTGAVNVASNAVQQLPQEPPKKLDANYATKALGPPRVAGRLLDQDYRDRSNDVRQTMLATQALTVDIAYRAWQDGYSYNQISRWLDTSPSTIRNWITEIDESDTI